MSVEALVADQSSVGGTQKGDIVKDLMKTCFDNGINMFDVSFAHLG
jgi:aryl-alcohol dehydrogenase-like predicted oxidoreductase